MKTVLDLIKELSQHPMDTPVFLEDEQWDTFADPGLTLLEMTLVEDKKEKVFFYKEPGYQAPNSRPALLLTKRTLKQYLASQAPPLPGNKKNS